MTDRRTIADLAEQVLHPKPDAQRGVQWWLYRAQALAAAHERMIADLRWLGEARAEYDHYDKRESNAARILADILEGKNDAMGWLPSWKWDEWAERND